MNLSYYQLSERLGRIIQQQRLAEAEGDDVSTAELKTAAGRLCKEMTAIVERDLKQ